MKLLKFNRYWFWFFLFLLNLFAYCIDKNMLSFAMMILCVINMWVCRWYDNILNSNINKKKEE